MSTLESKASDAAGGSLRSQRLRLAGLLVLAVLPATSGCGEDTPVYAGDLPTACSDGQDNDGDGAVDHPADPGCSSAADGDEDDASPPPACADGTDNDGDGKSDYPDDPGCNSSGDDDEFDVPPPPPVCQPLAGPGSEGSSDCLNCLSSGNMAAAYDGNDTTYAGFSIGRTGQGMFGVDAPEGVAFDAGDVAGALVRISENQVGYDLRIATTLDGVPQESRIVDSRTVGGCTGVNCQPVPTGVVAVPRGADVFWGFETSLPFDGIEASFTQTFPCGSCATRVYELCARAAE